MKNVRLIMGLMCFSVGIVMVAAQEQILDVSIQVKGDKSFRRTDVDCYDLEKYGRFGMKKAEPFGTYFCVTSALYNDCLDNVECVEVRKDLVKNIPQMIQQDLSKKKKFESVGIYTFPKYVSGSFIERVKKAQESGHPIKHTIYKDGQKGLVLQYKVEFVEAKQQQAALINVAQVCSAQKDSYQIKSFFDNELAIDLSAAFLLLLTITNQ